MKMFITSLMVTYSLVTFAQEQSETITNNKPVKKTLCVFDPVGANGAVFQRALDYKTNALEWGVDFNVKPYVDERVASDDFQSNVCDAVMVTGIRARTFNQLTGSIDAVGAVPSYDIMQDVVNTLSGPKAAPLMTEGEFEVVGIAPGGSTFIFVNDKSINNDKAIQGKRVATFNADPAQKKMVAALGATPIDASIAGMYSQFNNGAVDICFGPAAVFSAMELQKGMGDKGGVINFPIGQISLQVIARKSEFSENFGQASRSYFQQNFEQYKVILEREEQNIDSKYWIDISDDKKPEYNESFRKTRIAMRDEGYFNTKMLNILRKIRCRKDAQRLECAAENKE